MDSCFEELNAVRKEFRVVCLCVETVLLFDDPGEDCNWNYQRRWGTEAILRTNEVSFLIQEASHSICTGRASVNEFYTGDYCRVIAIVARRWRLCDGR